MGQIKNIKLHIVTDIKGEQYSGDTMTMTCYVEVKDNVGGEDDESIELPAEKDGTLLLSTVAAVFPGAIGLRYQGASGLWRACRMVENIIDPPLEGWEGILFQIVRQGTK